MAITFFGGIDSSGRPLTTAPAALPPNSSTSFSRVASISRTRALGKRPFSRRTKSEPSSTRARLSSATPRAQRARVNAPVPAPSSMTGPVAGEISDVMSSASARPDGTTAPTCSGSEIQARTQPMVSTTASIDTGLVLLLGHRCRGRRPADRALAAPAPNRNRDRETLADDDDHQDPERQGGNVRRSRRESGRIADGDEHAVPQRDPASRSHGKFLRLGPQETGDGGRDEPHGRHELRAEGQGALVGAEIAGEPVYARRRDAENTSRPPDHDHGSRFSERRRHNVEGEASAETAHGRGNERGRNRPGAPGGGHADRHEKAVGRQDRHEALEQGNKQQTGHPAGRGPCDQGGERVVGEHRMAPQAAGRPILTVLILEYSADIDTVNIRGATTRGRA